MSDDSIIGRQFANFRVLRHLGHGGMADVYLGHDVTLQRPVAIKVLDTRHQDNAAYARRFVREARSIALWRHDHIIQVYYAGEEDNLSYFVMEYIDGKDLAETLRRYRARRKLMPPGEVIRIGRAVADALDYAHQQGVVHRDIKPSNVMLAKDGRVVLMDFGLALDISEGSVGEVFGSASYISPEQARNSAEAVPQSDLYSLGVMLYEMLVGRLPFDDPSFTTVAVQHITAPPPPPRELNPALNEATEAVLLKALHKTPDRRYRTAGQLMDALEKALQLPAPAPAGKSAKETASPPVKKSTIRTTRSAAPAATSARQPSTPAAAAPARRTVAPATTSTKKAAPPADAAKTPAEPAPVADPDFYRRLGLVAGGVVLLLLLLLLVLWLLSNPAEAAMLSLVMASGF